MKSKLISFFYILLKNDYTSSQREEFWLNSVNHFQGDHKKCPLNRHESISPVKNASKPGFVQCLIAYLNETVKLLRSCDKRYSTNQNESFNFQKAWFAPKIYSYKGSYQGRMACAILQCNFPHMWIFEVRRRLGLPCLPPIVISLLNSMQINKEKTRLKHNS